MGRTVKHSGTGMCSLSGPVCRERSAGRGSDRPAIHSRCHARLRRASQPSSMGDAVGVRGRALEVMELDPLLPQLQVAMTLAPVDSVKSHLVV
jgi:hypothetical protein